MADTRPAFETYDERTADGLRGTSELSARGLPGYLGVDVTDVGPGFLVGEIEAREELLTPFGTLHGGVMAALVDHVLGVVLYPLMKRGQWAATTEFKLNYLAPVREGKVVARSEVLSITRRTGVVRAEVTNNGRLVCVAQGTLLITDPKP